MRSDALSGERELFFESDAPLAPTEAQSPLVTTSLGLEGPELLPVPALPLALCMLRALAGGHLIASPEAEVFGVRAPPVESGPVSDDGPVTAGLLEPLAPPAAGDCANAMPDVAVRAIRSVMDEKAFMFSPLEKLRTYQLLLKVYCWP
jgi:hypothetical protein